MVKRVRRDPIRILKNNKLNKLNKNKKFGVSSGAVGLEDYSNQLKDASTDESEKVGFFGKVKNFLVDSTTGNLLTAAVLGGVTGVGISSLIGNEYTEQAKNIKNLKNAEIKNSKTIFYLNNQNKQLKEDILNINKKLAEEKAFHNDNIEIIKKAIKHDHTSYGCWLNNSLCYNPPKLATNRFQPLT
jgi:hypothetical protein